MKGQLLIAGWGCSALAIVCAFIGAPPLLVVLMLGIGLGLKIAYLFFLP